MMNSANGSRRSGWHLLSVAARRQKLSEWLSPTEAASIRALENGGLDLRQAESLVENVVGLYSLPFAVAPNFLVNDKEVLVPMVTEEPSVVAAASNAARIVYESGGFRVKASAAIMTCQIQLFVDDFETAHLQIMAHKQELLALAARVDPVLKAKGGGPVDLHVRTLWDESNKPFCLVVHLHVDVKDAMGANIVNSMGELLVLHLEKITNGRGGLSILTNLADQRMVTVRVDIPIEYLSVRGFEAERVRDGIVSASRFAEIDPYRAATHNKGIMNGIDAVLLATGNDFRAVEAGAHAYAARDGRYRPLCVWRTNDQGSLIGLLEMPVAVGIVGGATRVHPLALLALTIMKITTAEELAQVVASVGLANNLAALRALATEGIQKGHMRLHQRSRHLATNNCVEEGTHE